MCFLDIFPEGNTRLILCSYFSEEESIKFLTDQPPLIFIFVVFCSIFCSIVVFEVLVMLDKSNKVLTLVGHSFDMRLLHVPFICVFFKPPVCKGG